MSETIKISAQGGDEDVADFGRAHSDRLQKWARGIVSSLYMLLRSVKMYDPDNAVFKKPLISLAESINAVIAVDSRFELMTVKDSFYLNNMLVKVDLNALDNVRYLVAELRARDVGGFSLMKPVSTTELQNFIWIFAREQHGSPGEDGLADRKLIQMKLAKWSRLKEKFDGDLDNPNESKVDRKKYAMTVYARAIFYLRKYLESVRAGNPIGTGKALRIIQDLVDISWDQRTHFLGMTTLEWEKEYLCYHQVNVCLMSIIFGMELGLTKPQLRDLGYVAIFHDAGMALLPEELSTKKGALTSDERVQVGRAPLLTVKAILKEKHIARSTLMRVVATIEHKADFGTAVRDARGNIQKVIPRSSLGLYAKILAICDAYDALTSKRPFRDAYGPEIALMLMWTEMRHRFDPELLTVFMKVMAIQPVKVLSKRQRSITVGVL